MFLSTAGLSQSLEKEITIGFKAQPLSDALNQIKNNHGIFMSYSSTDLKSYRIKSIPVAKRSIRELLELILFDLPVSFKETDQIIVIIPKPSNPVAEQFKITGHIQDNAGQPLHGVVITTGDLSRSTISDTSGNFELNGINKGTEIEINAIGFKLFKMVPDGSKHLLITLNASQFRPLDTVAVNTGYGTYNKDRTAGAFSYMDSTAVNRNVLPNIMDRLEGMLSSVQFVKNIPLGSSANETRFSIRGRSTINSNPQPLVVIDNFPYTGSMETINPHDVESVTLLKDAGSSSIWGSLSGNGVIVLATKRGKYMQRPRMDLTSNVSIYERPNFNYNPRLDSRSYLEFESFLFSKGYYDINSPTALLSPAGEILLKVKNGEMGSIDSAAAMDRLGIIDSRQGLTRYFSRVGLSQQTSINYSGGTKNQHYYFSGSAYNNLQNLKRNSVDRYTFTGNHTIHAFKNKLEANTSVFITENNLKENNFGDDAIWPYLEYADAHGRPMTVPTTIRQSYKDLVGSAVYLDWNNRPIDELENRQNRFRIIDYRINSQLQYTIAKGIQLQAKYQHAFAKNTLDDYYSPASYPAREMINFFTGIDPSTGKISRAIPIGGILDQSEGSSRTNNLRLMGTVQKKIKNAHEFNGLLGFDMRTITIDQNVTRKYGYNPYTQQQAQISYTTSYPIFIPGATARITNKDASLSKYNNYLSYFSSLNYLLLSRYFAMVSVRRDESNLFGENINRKGVPLVATAVAWVASRERFFKVNWIQELKFRISTGHSGNVNTTVSTYNTAVRSRINNRFMSSVGELYSPANNNLGWEKIRLSNAGIDFSLFNNQVSGSIDYYLKKGTGLIGMLAADPTTGFTQYTGNAASIRTRGLDLTLNFKKNFSGVNYSSTLLFNFNRETVEDYRSGTPTVGDFAKTGQLTVIPGRPMYGVYSIEVRGLNSQGSPVAVLDGKETTAYSNVLASTNLANLRYHGSANPVIFGSLLNSVSWKGFTLSSLLMFKAAYYIRVPSINYYNLAQGTGVGHPDYKLRWQKPGDEHNTTVPGLIYPLSSERDMVYNFSQQLVQRGDHIRLQDVKLSYQIKRNTRNNLHIRSMQIYAYLNNLGILWRANTHKIDPDAVPYEVERVSPRPLMLTLGTNINF